MSTSGGNWQERFHRKLRSPAQAMAMIGRGQRVFIGSGAAEPQILVKALAARSGHLADNQIVHIMTLGIAPYVEPQLNEGFRHNAFFIGPNVREAVAEGRADYTPIFLSELPRLFREGRVPIDVALIQVSPPDEHGYCSYGVSVDVVKAGAECARLVIAQVNRHMPRTLGDSFIHVDQIHALVEGDEAILESSHGSPDQVAQRIGRHIADLVEDGSTLQMGIGTIPDAVLACLGDKKDLGIHTEMFSDGVIDLVEQGVITGRRKSLHAGKIVASFVMGSRRLYDFVDNNPRIEFHPSEYTNDPFRIAQNDRMVAINSALEVDLTGQVCADSLGEYFYSGIGGQVDFVRGAARSQGGKAIIALPSTAQGGRQSRIVVNLKPGAGVVTSRGDVHYIVTEFGVAYLHGKTMRERALALIHIAHPDFREALMAEARQRSLVYPDQVAVLGVGTLELEDLECDWQCKNGTPLKVRPIKPTDEEMMRELFYSLSPETVYHRFFSGVQRMPHRVLKDFVTVDYRRSLALVAVAQNGEREEIIGVGRYAVDMAANQAEVAFLVRDDWQKQGLGTYLLQRLIEVARSRGIVEFTADVLADNTVMMHLFHANAPSPIRSKLRDGVYQLQFAIGLHDVPAGSETATNPVESAPA
ncbi:MAG: GNAT family N-acetyltransferase [Planctomycetota bacterium]|nr:MAG: GNAT family N-acetyltransferase [Planctomycetota bacterium]